MIHIMLLLRNTGPTHLEEDSHSTPLNRDRINRTSLASLPNALFATAYIIGLADVHTHRNDHMAHEEEEQVEEAVTLDQEEDSRARKELPQEDAPLIYD